jgi:hypothetical protein
MRSRNSDVYRCSSCETYKMLSDRDIELKFLTSAVLVYVVVTSCLVHMNGNTFDENTEIIKFTIDLFKFQEALNSLLCLE